MPLERRIALWNLERKRVGRGNWPSRNSNILDRLEDTYHFPDFWIIGTRCLRLMS